MKRTILEALERKRGSKATTSTSTAVADRSIRTLMQELKHETPVLSETPLGRLQRVLKIYGGLKPLLAILGATPLIPYPWRAALKTFAQSLEALSATAPAITAAFKAGKDL